MAWCLTAPSHYLNQCWLIIRITRYCIQHFNDKGKGEVKTFGFTTDTRFLPCSAVLSGVWLWFVTIWEWHPMFLRSYHRENHYGRNRIHHGHLRGLDSDSWVCIPKKSFVIAPDFWNTNSLGWTPFLLGAHDGFSISHPHGQAIVPFHKGFSPSGEQLKHRKLAHDL